MANFGRTGKVDLPGSWRKISCSTALEKFSYLTGRSLTTFKTRLWQVVWHNAAAMAHPETTGVGALSVRGKEKKTVDVCYEVGFENLSHFSYAFKRQYGYSPTELIGKTGA
jgi:AraC-like DNA-binding protein